MAMSFNDIMDYRKGNREVYNMLKDYISKNHLTPFIGAGLSAFIYPAWGKTLSDMCGNFIDMNEHKNEYIKIMDLISNYKYLLAASSIEKVLGESQFYTFLRNIYGLDKFTDNHNLNKETVYLLPYLFTNRILTTNFDQLIEKVYAEHKSMYTVGLPKNSRLFFNSSEENNCSIIKLHGDIKLSDNNDIVFTHTAYKRHYDKSSELYERLNNIMQTSLLFLGCSLSIDKSMEILKRKKTEGLIHFAIIDAINSEKSAKAKKLADTKNIFSIIYPSGEYDCVRIILEKLIEDIYPDKYSTLDIYFNKIANTSNRFIFRSQKTDFMGREREMKELLEFVNTPNDYPLWWAITGSGGSGKSRLAFELIKRIKSKWYCQFISKYKHMDLDKILVSLSRDTLIVIDYVQAYSHDIGEFLYRISSQPMRYKLRILLIEREDVVDKSSSWLDNIFRGSSSKSTILEMAFNNDLKMLKLSPIPFKKMIKIMESYVHNVCENQITYKTLELLYTKLAMIDSDLKRPLYAMFITDAYINGKNALSWDKEKTLEYVTTRETDILRNNIKYLLNDQGDRFYLNFVALKAFATISYGITLDDTFKNEILIEMEDYAKSKGWSLKSLLYTLGFVEKMDNIFSIAPMEPDIVGEYFVWSVIDTLDSNTLIQLYEQINNDIKQSISFFYKLFRDHKELVKCEIHKLIKIYDDIQIQHSSDKEKYYILIADSTRYFSDEYTNYAINLFKKLYDVNKDNKIGLLLCRCLRNYSHFVALEKRQELSTEVGILFRELNSSEDSAFFYVGTLHNLANRQDVEDKLSTLKIIEDIHDMFPYNSEIKRIKSVTYISIGTGYHQKSQYNNAAVFFEKAVKMGNLDGNSFLAHMIRQKKAPENFNGLDLMELLSKPIKEKHPLGIINAVLYSSSLGDEKNWFLADEYMSNISNNDDVSILVNWAKKLSVSKNEFNQLDGKLTLLWLIRHRYISIDAHDFSQADLHMYVKSKLRYVPEWIIKCIDIE